MKKVEIIPAILPQDFAELQDKVELITGSVKRVQVDICDGQFVPNATWPYKKHDLNFEKIVSEEEGLPGWKELDFEFDLMINRPEEVIADWVSTGAARIVLHAESKGNLTEAIDYASGIVELGLALNIDTSVDVIEPYKDKINFVQCMGIDNIGFQGQEFDLKAVDKIKEIRSKYPEMIISVDGGVSLENAADLAKAGADRLIVGSAVFESDNIYDAIAKLKKIVH